ILTATESLVTVACVRTLTRASLRGFSRVAALAGDLTELLDQHRPDLVVIEGYGYANKFTLVPLVEIGTAMRWELLKRGFPTTTMAPKALKQFITGNGNADKKAMKQAVSTRWGFATKDDNQADAYGLAMAGLAFAGAIKCTLIERECVSTLSFLSCISPVTVP